jgi:hypothetical protein
MTRVVFTILAAALFCSFTQVQASPITYTITTTATGTLGASPFTDAAITLTLTGNTSAVEPLAKFPIRSMLLVAKSTLW